MRIGRIPYLSCEPFYFEMRRRGVPLQDFGPRAMAEALARGEIDAGPVPLAECFRLADAHQLLSGFCVATISKAGSVLLRSTVPIKSLGGAAIGIPAQASTSLRLLQVLLIAKYEVRPRAYVSPEDPHDALLFIGNEALRQRRGTRGYPYSYDLGAEWHQWTRLPFVFARWLVRKDADPRAVAVLEDTLYVGLQDWADGIFRSSPARDELMMHPRDVLAYTQGIRYFVGRPEQRAEERFRALLKELKLQ